MVIIRPLLHLLQDRGRMMINWEKIFRGSDCRIWLMDARKKDNAELCWQVFDRYAAGQGEHRTIAYKTAYSLFGAETMCRVEQAAAGEPGRYIIGSDRIHLDGRYITAAGFALAWKYTRERVMQDKQDQCRQILGLLDGYSLEETRAIIERGKKEWTNGYTQLRKWQTYYE